MATLDFNCSMLALEFWELKSTGRKVDLVAHFCHKGALEKTSGLMAYLYTCFKLDPQYVLIAIIAE